MEFYTALFILIIALLFVLGLAHVLYRLFNNWAPGKKRLAKDVEQMRSEAQAWMDRLVPWESTEMELFSLNNKVLSSSKTFGKSLEGIFKSIYHEPMLYYVYREYISRKRNAVLLIRTSEHEFLFRYRKGRIGVYLNDEPIGWLDDERSILYDPDKEKELARVHTAEQAYLPISIQDQEVAHLNRAEHSDKVNPRAFSLLDNNLNEQEESILIGMSAFQLIEQQLEQRL